VRSLLWPLLAQIGLTCALYVWLTVARAGAVKRGEVAYSAFALGRDEPPGIARISRNLANQFELPVIFYAMVVLLVTLGQSTLVDTVAAWVFVAGRIVHTLVQTLTDDVPLRGRVFVINFLAVLVLIGHVALLALSGVGL
jgi:hypothetical protein